MEFLKYGAPNKSSSMLCKTENFIEISKMFVSCSLLPIRLGIVVAGHTTDFIRVNLIKLLLT
jgi:hypothetical protein